MKKQLHISLIQESIQWEDAKSNYTRLDELFQSVSTETDLIVLPEMFTTGFSMEPHRIAEPMADDMPTLMWMRKWAKFFDACVTGSVSVSDSGVCYNRLFWVFPDGTFQYYDKRHTFTFAGEDKVYSRGIKPLIVEWQGWKIKPLICYDLRFPIWSKNRIKEDQASYDLLLYVANWPGVRRDPWNKLLPARAIENQCYLAAVNRVGIDGNGLEYTGDSVVLDPRGATLAQADPGQHSIITATIASESLLDFREKFPVLYDDDDELV